MEVNSIRSTGGYPRRISLEPTKASNKPLCFHDFGRIPLCQLQQGSLAHRDSRPRHTRKHSALLIRCFSLLLTTQSVRARDIGSFRLQSLARGQTEADVRRFDTVTSLGLEARWEIHLTRSGSTLSCAAGTWGEGRGHPGVNLSAPDAREATA